MEKWEVYMRRALLERLFPITPMAQLTGSWDGRVLFPLKKLKPLIEFAVFTRLSD